MSASEWKQKIEKFERENKHEELPPDVARHADLLISSISPEAAFHLVSVIGAMGAHDDEFSETEHMWFLILPKLMHHALSYVTEMDYLFSQLRTLKRYKGSEDQDE